MSDKLFTGKQMQWTKADLSARKEKAALNVILSNDRIAKALNKPEEIKEVYSMMKEEGANGLTRKGMRKVLTRLRKEGKTINTAERMELAKGTLGSSQWYDYSTEKKQSLNKNSQASANDKTVKKYGMPSRPRFEVRSKIQNTSSSPRSRYELKVANPVTSLGAGLSSQPARQSNPVMRPKLGLNSRLSSSRLSSIKK